MAAHNAQAPASATEPLVVRLRAAADDAVRLREIVEGNDSASVAAAFAALLTGPGRKKTHNRPFPSAPNETLLEILLFADRDALDAMQLVCRFLLEFIRDREADDLPLRSISQVNIGKCARAKFRGRWERHWLPIVEVVRCSNDKNGRAPCSVSRLVLYLRLAYCGSIRVDLRSTRCVHTERDLRAILFDLVVPNTFVDVLTVVVDDDRQHAFALRAFEAFKPLSNVVMKLKRYWRGHFDEAFFLSAAECGVQSIKFDSGRGHIVHVGLLPALAFVFAKPTTGGELSISGVECDIRDENFLAEVIKKASELDGGQRIDFKFTIDDLSKYIATAGFEKYAVDEWSWVVDDLENGITVKVVDADPFPEIHVFSST